MKKLNSAVHVCNFSAGEAEAGGRWRSVAGQPRPPGELQAGERTCSRWMATPILLSVFVLTSCSSYFL